MVLTIHRLAYLCCQCDASIDMKLALGLEVASYDLQLNINEHDSSIYRDLTTVYTNDSWFVILLSCAYFGDWVTKICHFSPLKTNNSVQLRTLPKIITGKKKYIKNECIFRLGQGLFINLKCKIILKKCINTFYIIFKVQVERLLFLKKTIP